MFSYFLPGSGSVRNRSLDNKFLLEVGGKELYKVWLGHVGDIDPWFSSFSCLVELLWLYIHLDADQGVIRITVRFLE